MSNFIKRDIFSINLLYIIRLVVISLILFNFVSIVYAESVDNGEPFEIWEKSTLQIIPETEEIILDEESADIQNLSNDEYLESSDVIESGFSYSTDDTLGLIDDISGGFDANIWKGSGIKDIEYLLIQSPYTIYNSTLRNLKQKLLLTIATPPLQESESEKNFFEIKLEHFKNIGDYDSIFKFSELIKIDEWSQELLQTIINYYLIYGEHKRICREEILRHVLDETLDLQIRSFCNAMSNNLPAIDLNISLLQEEGNYDEELIYILSSYLNGTEILLENIEQIDLYKLTLLENKKIDFSEYIKNDTNIDLQMFYSLSSIPTNEKKVSIVENLVSQGTLQHDILSKSYNQYLLDNNMKNGEVLENSELSTKDRILLYNQIRNTSNQKELISLTSEFVNEMSEQNLLINSAPLIYDKIKIINPKQEFKDHTVSVCLVLIINGDMSQCQKWLKNLEFIKDTRKIKLRIGYLMSLKSDEILFKADDIQALLLEKNISENKKNLIAKHFEILNNISLLDYWKKPSALEETSSSFSNIKLAQYLNSISNSKKGESILLMNTIHKNKYSSSLDHYSLFLILNSLNNLDKIYLNNFVFEYFVNNPI